MEISKLLTDQAVLTELGKRLARRRIDFQLTQANLAEQAGVSKRTLERVEAGSSAQTASIVRIFRALDLLQALEHMIPAAGPSPMDLLKLKGKVRQRVKSSSRSSSPDEEWSWND